MRATDQTMFDAVTQAAAWAEKVFIVTDGWATVRGEGSSQGDYIAERDNALVKIGRTKKTYGDGTVTLADLLAVGHELQAELSQLVSCEVTLNGDVVSGDECRGTLSVDGKPLSCNRPDGWRLKDKRTLELTGNACSDLKQTPAAQIQADFPCGVVLF
jgi:hypothetical protein